MQKAKTEAEEAARRKSETLDQHLSESRQSSSAPKEESEQPPTPKQSSATPTPTPENTTQSDSPAKGKHHKTKSESAREATFASLQRALNAACAARPRFSRKGSRKPDSVPEEEPISPTSMAPPATAPQSREGKRQPTYNSGYSDWAGVKDEASWGSSHSQAETSSFHPANQSIPEVPTSSHSVQQNGNAYSGTQYQTAEWTEAHKEHMSPQNIGADAGMGYNMQYPMQAPDISVSRRDSSDALSTTLNGIGICTSESGMPALNRAGGSSWEKSGKELDLAARRKRPRPAAIGTSNTRSLAASTSMSSLSPTSRMPSSGAGNSMRHSKSAQNLNTRYAGVRKASAAQRSPLNFTFAESGSMKSSKAEMLRPSVSSSNLAPPTPLTPQDFQHFMPASPTESNYCMSAHSTTQFFPTSQPMQVNIASPPTTPLDIYSPFTYQNVAPPMSAPAQVSNFPEYVSCDPVPMSARSWADTGALSSPEFQSGLQVPHSATVSPIGYDAAVEHTGQAYGMEPVSGSPSLIYSIEDVDHQGSMDERKQAEFRMHDFAEQHHDSYSAHLASVHRPKAYTFANNTTPTNYPS